jgi:hypothetical protein
MALWRWEEKTLNLPFVSPSEIDPSYLDTASTAGIVPAEETTQRLYYFTYFETKVNVAYPTATIELTRKRKSFTMKVNKLRDAFDFPDMQILRNMKEQGNMMLNRTK